MKKILFFLIALVISAAASAQSTPEAERYKKNIMAFLKTEGYAPYIDEEDDNSLSFKKEGTLYWIYFDDKNPVYIEFHAAALDTEGADVDAIYKAMNATNRAKRCVKTTLSKDGTAVGFVIEFFSNDPQQFKDAFDINMKIFDIANDYMMEKYNEFKE